MEGFIRVYVKWGIQELHIGYKYNITFGTFAHDIFFIQLCAVGHKDFAIAFVFFVVVANVRISLTLEVEVKIVREMNESELEKQEEDDVIYMVRAFVIVFAKNC
jgi:hypothetical protein